MHLNAILPPEAVSNGSRLIMADASQLLIEGHKGLIAYDSRRIQTRLHSAQLTITGENLVIAQFTAEDMLICGDIRLLEFTR